jgi:hypothetical protein
MTTEDSILIRPKETQALGADVHSFHYKVIVD